MDPQDTQLNTISCIFLQKIKLNTVKPVLSGQSQRRQELGFQDRLWLNAGQKYCRMLPLEHSAILSTFIKLPFVIKIVLSFFEWPLKTGFTLTQKPYTCCVKLYSHTYLRTRRYAPDSLVGTNRQS